MWSTRVLHTSPWSLDARFPGIHRSFDGVSTMIRSLFDVYMIMQCIPHGGIGL